VRKILDTTTYIETRNGWVYLCVVIDLYSRMVVGYSIANNMRSEMVCMALERAIHKRKPPRGLMIHSDRGSQFGSHLFESLIKKNGFVQSMSRKGNCWDNACAESFFHLIKSEELRFVSIKSIEDAKYIIFNYIEVFYNRKRIHSTLGYLSPTQFEESVA
jgi:putative transposase